VRLVVAGGTLWLLFALALMLNVLGQRRLMRIADVLLGIEFLALITAFSLDVESVSTVVGLVVVPSVAVGFLVFCVQQGLRASGGD
jgi:hypothetical protein